MNSDLFQIFLNRSERFEELSKYILSYELYLKINITKTSEEIKVDVNIYDKASYYCPNYLLLLAAAIQAYLEGNFLFNLQYVERLAYLNCKDNFVIPEIACIILCFFIRKRYALGASETFSFTQFSRFTASAISFYNYSSLIQGELLEIYSNTLPGKPLKHLINNVKWRKPPENISLNNSLYNFGHLATLPLFWVYINQIFANRGEKNNILYIQSCNIIYNYFARPPCKRVASKVLSYLTDSYVKQAFISLKDGFLSNGNSPPSVSTLRDSHDPVDGGGTFFYNYSYYDFTTFGSWLNYSADQGYSKRPHLLPFLENCASYHRCLQIRQHLIELRESGYSRIIALHVKDGSYKGYKQDNRIVPSECYSELIALYPDTFFIILGESFSANHFESIYYNCIALESLCRNFLCKPDVTQFALLYWIDGLVGSSSGIAGLPELFQIPTLILGGLDSIFYSSYILRMPSKVTIGGEPVTNEFYEQNPDYARYFYSIEYNSISSNFQLEYLSTSAVCRAYSKYLLELDRWRLSKPLIGNQYGPFFLPQNHLFDYDPIKLYHASLVSKRTRIDPWLFC